MSLRSLRFLSTGFWWRKFDWSKRVNAENADVCAARLFTICLLVAVVLSANLIVVHANPPQAASAERVLFEAANRERAAQGLAQLRWDDALANAARNHAVLMAQQNALSHQFPGEPALQDRARVAGARFTEVAENVAEGGAADAIHSGWMHSPHHRANLLDPELTAIGIAVVGQASRGANSAGSTAAGDGAGMLFAVEDFSQSVANLSLAEQERQVRAALAARGLQISNDNGGGLNRGALISNESNGGGSNSIQPIANRTSTGMGTDSQGTTAIGSTEDARKTCEMERGWAGGRPALVMRYESGDLSHLPVELEQKIQTGRYRVAAVGACQTASSSSFARFRVAVLLF
jgi:Cysteine-rich secretory protein family